jgi:hypothetical protein
MLPRTLSQAQLIEQIKKTSSKWIKAVDTRCRTFAWLWRIFDAVLQYIDGQKKEHHRARTFQEEYRELWRKHGVDFEER